MKLKFYYTIDFGFFVAVEWTLDTHDFSRSVFSIPHIKLSVAITFVYSATNAYMYLYLLSSVCNGSWDLVQKLKASNPWKAHTHFSFFSLNAEKY